MYHNLIFIIVNLVLGVECIILNGIVIKFYYMKKQDIIPFLYIVLCSCDLLSGVNALVDAVISFCGVSLEIYDSEDRPFWLISISYLLTTVASRTSIYYNVVLAIIRTINIIRPFYLVKKKYVVICIVLYPLLWLSIGVAELIIQVRNNDLESIYFLYLHPLPGLNVILGDYHILGTPAFVTVLILITIPFLVPTIIMIVCAIIQSVSLLTKSFVINTDNVSINNSRASVSLGNHGNVTKQRNMTVTIFLITALCIVCNTGYIIYIIVFRTLPLNSLTVDMYFIITYTMSTTLPFINASLNPIIFLTRGSALRQHIMECTVKPIRQSIGVAELIIQVRNNDPHTHTHTHARARAYTS